MLTVYLLCGVCGSGKSTLANELLSAGLAQCIAEADQYFIKADGSYQFDASRLYDAHRFCQEKARHALAKGDSVIVSNTSTTEKEIATYQKMAEDFGARFISLVVS